MTFARRVRGDVRVTPFTVALGAGLAVRLVLMLTTLIANDNAVYGTVIEAGRANQSLYRSAVFSYPPVPGYYYLAIGHVLQLFGAQTFVRYEDLLRYEVPGLTSFDLTTPLATFFIKLPSLVLDCICVSSILRAAAYLGFTRANAERAAIFYWLNPMTLWSGGVAGTWDAAVPIVFIETVLLVASGRWFTAGALIALGAFTRIVPGYAVVFALPLALWIREATSIGAALRVIAVRVALFAAGGLIVGEILLSPIAWWGDFGAMRHALLARFGDFAPAGLTLLSFVYLEPFAAVLDFVQSHRGLFVTVYGLLGSVAPLAVMLGSLLTLGQRRAPFIAATVLTVSFIVFSPFVQGNYVLWLLPLLVLSERPDERFWPWLATLLGAVAAAFAHVVRGTAGVLYPACAWYHWCDPRVVADRALAYHDVAGTLSATRQIEVDALLGELGGIALLIIAILTYRRFLVAIRLATRADR